MSEWDDIEGVEGWTKKLNELLGEAEAMAKNQNMEDRLALSRRLTDFILQSGPHTPEIKELDEIAGETAKGLMLGSIDDRLKSIRAASVEYAKLTKQFETQAGAASAAAGSIRLDRIRRVTTSLTDSINAVKELRTGLTEGEDDELATRLDRAMKSLQDFRNSIERTS